MCSVYTGSNMVPDALLQTKQKAPRQQVLVIYAQHNVASHIHVRTGKE